MKKISLSTLFNIPHNEHKKISIKSIFEDTTGNKFSYHYIMKNKQLLIEQEVKTYNKIYSVCCLFIKRADNQHLTSIKFDIPEFVPDCTTFNSSKCIGYIMNKLRHEYLDCYIVDKNKIKIDWKNIEENINKAKR